MAAGSAAPHRCWHLPGEGGREGPSPNPEPTEGTPRPPPRRSPSALTLTRSPGPWQGSPQRHYRPPPRFRGWAEPESPPRPARPCPRPAPLPRPAPSSVPAVPAVPAALGLRLGVAVLPAGAGLPALHSSNTFLNYPPSFIRRRSQPLLSC